jgi:CheY-like chemotaxis protein
MKKLLLIEDDDVKRQGVISTLNSLGDFEIVLANSVSSAIASVSNEIDLIIADMSLPTYDIVATERGGTPRPFGGVEVFEHLERIGSSVPVVVVTSYPAISDGKRSLTVNALERQLANDFPENFKGLVYFDFAYTDWERELVRKIQLLRGGER